MILVHRSNEGLELAAMLPDSAQELIEPTYPVPAINSVPLRDYGNGNISFTGLLVFAGDLFWE